MSQAWYVNANGQIEGPLTLDELNRRAAAGQLLPTDNVSPDRVSWVTALELDITFLPRTEHAQAPTVVSPLVPPRSASTDDTAAYAPFGVVPGYEVLEKLGAGACGVVYKARQVKLNRVVALKTVLLAENASPEVTARFEQEARSLARLQHPNVVAVYDCGHSGARAFFAMELLAGEDLKQRLVRAGALDERTTWLIARQIAAGLGHAAGLGIVHRDVKPANLFLVPPPTGFPLPPGVPMVKVTDFGLALTCGDGSEDGQHRTAEGALLGTPIYMAPEQFVSSGVDLKADIYSLGATVYHMLTGRPPFSGRTIWEIMKGKNEPAPRLQPPISTETAALVAAMLAANPAERPADYDELIARIDALPCLAGVLSPSSSDATRAVPPAPQPRPARRKRWRYGAAAAVVVGGIAVAIWAATRGERGSQAPPPPPATYVGGTRTPLYDGRSVIGWTGGSGYIEADEEKNVVLAVPGNLTRAFPPLEAFRVTLNIDPYKADVVEVIVATSDGTAGPAEVWSVRLDRKGGAAFGRRTGEGGAFVVTGKTIAIPSAEELAAAARRSYLLLGYERAGGKLTAVFQGEQLGSTPDTGLRTTSVSVRVTGGVARIDAADLEELVKKE
jgi:eukaryotic-like serine/threonine-protein kinase